MNSSGAMSARTAWIDQPCVQILNTTVIFNANLMGNPMTNIGHCLMNVIVKKTEAILRLHKGLRWVSNFNQSIIRHHHMKDRVEMDHLTKSDAFLC